MRSEIHRTVDRESFHDVIVVRCGWGCGRGRDRGKEEDGEKGVNEG